MKIKNSINVNRRTEAGGRSRQRSSSHTNLHQLDLQSRRLTYSGGIHRSSSNPNLNTPQRYQSVDRITPSSSQTEQRRKNVAENSQKVMQALQMDNEFFKRLNLSNGLKSMSAKQFVEIIAHFSIKISGKNLITNQNAASAKQKTSPEVQIMEFLQSLNYPYVINKSCLKTPNAQHMFKESVAMLAWLSDIIRYSEDEESPLTIDIQRDEEFPNEEYTKHFSDEVQNAFHLWSEGSDDAFIDVQQQLVEQFIQSKCFASIDGLIDKTAKLRKANEILGENSQQLANNENDEKRFESLNAEYSRLKSESKELKHVIASKQNYMQSITMKYESANKNAKAREAALQSLVEKIRKQKHSVADLKKVSTKVDAIKSTIESMGRDVQVFREEATAIEIKVARLRQQRSTIIAEFNRFAFKAAQHMIMGGTHENLDVNDFVVENTDDANAIEAACMRLKRLHNGLITAKERYRSNIEIGAANVTNLKKQEQLLESEYKKLMTKLTNANENLLSINSAILKLEIEFRAALAALQTTASDDELNELMREIADQREKKVRLEAENVMIFEAGQKKIKELFQARQKVLQNLDELNEHFDKLLQNLNQNKNRNQDKNE